jgi:hypothetical protein
VRCTRVWRPSVGAVAFRAPIRRESHHCVSLWINLFDSSRIAFSTSGTSRNTVSCSRPQRSARATGSCNIGSNMRPMCSLAEMALSKNSSILAVRLSLKSSLLWEYVFEAHASFSCSLLD